MNDSTIRSFRRGLEVLKALNTRNYLTALEISRACTLPRSTVYRVLETLMQAGYVVRDDITDVYSLTSEVTKLSSGYGPSAHVIEIAKPLLKAFSDEICWPSYIHVLESDVMVTRAIFRSPRALTYPRIGKKHPIASSAPGRAYLASLETDERRRWIQSSPEVSPVTSGNNWDLYKLNSLIRDAGILGCGFRDEGLVPRTCSISLPIRCGDNAAVYWTIVMMSAVITAEKAVSNYLNEARAIAVQIEQLAHTRQPHTL
ncbi:IclR family transcriptional regulator [Pusillimonas noertemannii]|uniref:IclR family transcriptional regulator n=2 Tax=Pusillimonas noertemannii TaxID=305977 RepID=A0A2U1CL30_9BURK|nr:IclR family transcriptional regulator [Pusillimonas noertemannii]